MAQSGLKFMGSIPEGIKWQEMENGLGMLKAATGRNKAFIYLYGTGSRLLINSQKILENFSFII